MCTRCIEIKTKTLHTHTHIHNTKQYTSTHVGVARNRDEYHKHVAYQQQPPTKF